eukprot:356348-Chlamydomonas_euryale.AAC.27
MPAAAPALTKSRCCALLANRLVKLDFSCARSRPPAADAAADDGADVDERALLASKQPGRDGKAQSKRFGKERAEREQALDMHAVEVGLQLWHATSGGHRGYIRTARAGNQAKQHAEADEAEERLHKAGAWVDVVLCQLELDLVEGFDAPGSDASGACTMQCH